MNKIRAGFFSFTEILDGEHHSYNEWHQLDHMPEQFPLRGIAHGQRWVSTPACRQARRVSHPELDRTHYLTLYLMTDPLEETLSEFRELGAQLSRLGRFHRHRRTHLVGPHLFDAAHVSPRVVLSPEALPWYPLTGIYVEVHEPHGPAGLDEWTMWRQRERIPELVATPGVVGAWGFAERTTTGLGNDPAEARRITVLYLDGDPVTVASTIAAAEPQEPPGVETRFAGPFETVRPYEWNWFDDEPS